MVFDMSPFKRIFSIFLTLLLYDASAQEYLQKDSLLQLLPSTPPDTSKVLLFISIGQQYENNKPDSAIYYYQQALDLSESLDYPTGILKYYSNITYVLNAQGHYDSALVLTLAAVDLAKKQGRPEQIAACLGNVANTYLYLERYETAIDYYLQTNQLLEKTGNKQYQCILQNSLAITYTKIRQPDKARNAAENSVRLAREINNPFHLGIGLDNLGLTYINTSNPEGAIPFLTEALTIAEETNNLYLKESIYLNFAQVYRQMGLIDKTLHYLQTGLQLALEFNDVSGEVIAHAGLGYYYLYKSQFDNAKNFGKKAEGKASAMGFTEQLRDSYMLLGYIALSEKNYKEFQHYTYKHDSIESRIVNKGILNNIQDLEVKYETERKNQQIIKLEQDASIQSLKIQRNNILLFVFAGLTVVVTIVSFLFVRSNRQKQLILKQEKEIQQRTIVMLEKEKYLTATQAVLKGQEEERTRLARDLHDGLGGMLSGIKLSMQQFTETIDIHDKKILLERNMDMLDSSVNELRRVAHNLMPEVLLKFGLDVAVKDFCNSITNSGALNISYQSIGINNLRADQTTQVTIYRIIQELMNNILKHAAANEAFVQLDFHGNNLGITVEDTGVGFDTRNLDLLPGIGWSNITTRVAYLNGKIEIKSIQEIGTTINIDIPIG